MVTLRQYQSRIAATAASGNTIVMLPTGAGKTLIAAETIRLVGSTAVMFVPSINLVSQQARCFRDWKGPSGDYQAVVAEYHGGESIPTGAFDVLVTTPKAFEMKMAQGQAFAQWARYGCVIFDEVHHTIRDHPYSKLADSLRRASDATPPICPRIVGLSASLTFSVTDEAIKKALNALFKKLMITQRATATEEELRTDGFTGVSRAAVADVRKPQTHAVDGTLPLHLRKPHLMHSQFFERVVAEEATPSSLQLLSVIRAMEKVMSENDHTFDSPLHKASLADWGEYASRLTGTLVIGIPGCNANRYGELEHWYEALRLMVTSWEELPDMAGFFIRMMLSRCRKAPLAAWPEEVQAAKQKFLGAVPEESPRFELLREVLLEKQSEMGRLKCIVFVTQRVCAEVLSYKINTDPIISAAGLKSVCVYAFKSPATASLKLSKSEFDRRIHYFRTGSVDILVATEVLREGLDVPDANCVIRFDAVVHSIDYVQGRGRARTDDASHVVLAERPDRSILSLAAAERKQLDIIANTDMQYPGANDLINAQSNRLKSAASIFNQEPSTQVLHMFAMKTRGTVQESYQREPLGWKCSLTYISDIRSVSANRTSANKKDAKRAASIELLQQIRAEFY